MSEHIERADRLVLGDLENLARIELHRSGPGMWNMLLAWRSDQPTTTTVLVEDGVTTEDHAQVSHIRGLTEETALSVIAFANTHGVPFKLDG